MRWARLSNSLSTILATNTGNYEDTILMNSDPMSLREDTAASPLCRVLRSFSYFIHWPFTSLSFHSSCFSLPCGKRVHSSPFSTFYHSLLQYPSDLENGNRSMRNMVKSNLRSFCTQKARHLAIYKRFHCNFKQDAQSKSFSSQLFVNFPSSPSFFLNLFKAASLHVCFRSVNLLWLPRRRQLS